MGKIVPDWQTYISCERDMLNIRHLKSGLAEDLEIPWPAKLKSMSCEKVRFREEELAPLSQYGKTLERITLENCEIAPKTLSVLAGAASLRCLCLKNCALSDQELDWFQGTPKLEILDLTGNAKCTGAVVARAVGSPLSKLYLGGTGLTDADIPGILSFPQLKTLVVSDTKVTAAALPQLAVNQALNIVCDHARDGVAGFRAAQRQNWKKKLNLDEKTAGEAMKLVKDFYTASLDSRQRRSGFVTERYLDYCKTHGYNGVDPGQKISFHEPFHPPYYQNYRVVDVEQITRKKFYVYSECDDAFLSQYRCLVVQTAEGWKIDKNEHLTEGKWRFWRLE